MILVFSHHVKALLVVCIVSQIIFKFCFSQYVCLCELFRFSVTNGACISKIKHSVFSVSTGLILQMLFMQFSIYNAV